MSRSVTIGGLRFGELRPEPGRFWIRYASRSWPWAGGWWQDLARAGLAPAAPARGRGGGLRPAAGEVPADDLVYLPPADGIGAERDDLARSLAARGVPVLVQLAPGEAPVRGAAAVYDLLAPLLRRDLDSLGGVPAGATASWPLVSGLTDDPDLWREGSAALAAAGAACVQGVALELGPAERRRLAEGAGEETFAALFHRPPPSERAFARVAAAAGLEVFSERPLPAAPRRLRTNRRLSARLALAGELWLRLGRSEAGGQGLYRAARHADAFEHDLEALWREGNLEVVDWLDATARSLVAETLEGGDAGLLAELRREYAGD